MKKIIVSVIWLASVSSCFAQGDSDLIKGEELRKSIAGKTIYVSTPLGELPVRYSGNGTMAASTSVHLAAMAGETVTSDTGTWWISGDRLCQKWRIWVEKRTFCYEMRGDKESVTWRRSDGKTGSARIGS